MWEIFCWFLSCKSWGKRLPALLSYIVTRCLGLCPHLFLLPLLSRHFALVEHCGFAWERVGVFEKALIFAAGPATLSYRCVWHCLWAATMQCLPCHDGCWWVSAWQANRLGVHAGGALPSSYEKEDVNLQTWDTEQCFSWELRPDSSKNASSV